jgi:hypothetical protein
MHEGSKRGKRIPNAVFITAIALLVTSIFSSGLSCRRRSGGHNEPYAISQLRTIHSAQELYLTRYGTYGSFADLSSVNMIDPVLASATSPASVKSGYYFSLTLETDAWWCCTARPGTPGVSGDRCFRIATDGMIYYKEEDDLNIATTKDAEVLK